MPLFMQVAPGVLPLEFDIFRQLLQISPTLALLTAVVYWIFRSQAKRDERDATRELRLAEERKELVKDFSETVRGFLHAVADQGKLISALTEQSRVTHDLILSKLDKR